MVEIGRRLRLGAEPPHIPGRSQLAGQDQFHRDEAIGADLARLVDNAHAAAGDLFQQFVIAEIADPGPRRKSTRCRLVCTDRRAGKLSRAGPVRLELLLRVDDRLFEETALRLMGVDQRFDSLPQSQVAGADFVQVGQAFAGGFLQGSGENGFDAFRVRLHGTAPEGSGFQRLPRQCAIGRRHASPCQNNLCPDAVVRRAEMVVKPGAGVSPAAIRRGAGDAQAPGRLLDGQPDKEAQLDHLGLQRIFLGETVQGFVDGEQVVRGRRRRRFSLLQIDALTVAAPLQPVLARALSTRMRRMASAAAAKKCPAVSQRCSFAAPTSRRYAS